MDFTARVGNGITQGVRTVLWRVCDADTEEMRQNAVVFAAMTALTGLGVFYENRLLSAAALPAIYGVYFSMQLSGKLIKGLLTHLFPNALSNPFEYRIGSMRPTIESSLHRLSCTIMGLGFAVLIDLYTARGVFDRMAHALTSAVGLKGRFDILDIMQPACCMALAGYTARFISKTVQIVWPIFAGRAQNPIPVNVPQQGLNLEAPPQQNLVNSVNHLSHLIQQAQIQNNSITAQMNVVRNEAQQNQHLLEQAANLWEAAVDEKKQALKEKNLAELKARLLEADIEKLSATPKRQASHQELYEDICTSLGLTDSILCDVFCVPTITKYGYSYERSSIAEWINENHIDPQNRQPLEDTDFAPNEDLQHIISIIDALTLITSLKKADPQELKSEVFHSLAQLIDFKDEALVEISGEKVTNRAYMDFQDTLKDLIEKQNPSQHSESGNIIIQENVREVRQRPGSCKPISS